MSNEDPEWAAVVRDDCYPGTYGTQRLPVPDPGATVEALQARVAELEAVSVTAQAKLSACLKAYPGVYEPVRKDMLEVLGLLVGEF